jgi:hypothetical protein
MTEDNSVLLHLATKASQLSSRMSRKSEVSRLAGRLIRDPHDLDALCRSIVCEAKAEGSVLADSLETGTGFRLLQFAIARVSDLCWEELWNDTHPDRFGQAWEGEDFELMSIWREKVGIIIEECHQEWLFLVSDADEYIAKLVEAGVAQEVAEELAAWLSIVRGNEHSEGGIDESTEATM